MKRQVATASPIALARFAGVLYLLSISLGLFEQMVVRWPPFSSGGADQRAA